MFLGLIVPYYFGSNQSAMFFNLTPLNVQIVLGSTPRCVISVFRKLSSWNLQFDVFSQYIQTIRI